jgi:hypothetical protein
MRIDDRKQNFLTWEVKALLVILIAVLLGILISRNAVRRHDLSDKKPGTLAMPVVSAVSFKEDEITFRFPDTGTDIYYTFNGSDPVKQGMLYKGELKISRSDIQDSLLRYQTSPRWKHVETDLPWSVTIQSIAVKGKERSEVSTQTFIQKEYQTQLPVYSLVLPPSSMFGRDSGIYVMGKNYEDKDRFFRKTPNLDIPWWNYPGNYQSRGKNAQRNAKLIVYDSANKDSRSCSVKVAIHGNATRGFNQKSLKIISDTSCRIWKDINKVHILRTGGNDYERALIRDAFVSQVLLHSGDFIVPDYKPVVLFINGAYWGLHYSGERADEDFIAEKYAVDRSKLDIIDLPQKIFYGHKGSLRAFKNVLKICKKPACSQQDLDSIADLVDLKSLTNYLIVETFFGNADWPVNNVRAWRSRDSSANPMNLKWKFIPVDFDLALGFAADANANDILRLSQNRWTGTLFKFLMTNETYSTAFRERAVELTSGYLSRKNLELYLAQLTEKIKGEMNYHVMRWHSPMTMNIWQAELSVVQSFIAQRSEIYLKHVDQYIVRQAGTKNSRVK